MKLSSLIADLKLRIRFHRGEKATREFVKTHACPPLSREDKRQIDEYWAQFGIRLRSYSSHQMYYAVTGVHDPRFIPKTISALTLVPHYNDLALTSAYSDKNRFTNIIPDMPFPKALGCRINRRYLDRDGVYYGEVLTDEYVRAIYQTLQQEKIDSIIIKVAIGSCAGKGVRKFPIGSEDALRAALTEFDAANFIIQDVVKQHPVFAQLNESSVNIIRCTSWRNGDEVHIFSPCIRFGIPGSATDVAYKDGVEIVNCVAIAPDGRIHDHAVSLDGSKTPLALTDWYVPQWEQIVAKIRSEHRKMHHFGIIAWDITVNDQNEIVCIEFNLKRPGSIVYQFAHGPMAGEHSDAYLACLKDPHVRRTLLPSSYLIRGFKAKK